MGILDGHLMDEINKFNAKPQDFSEVVLEETWSIGVIPKFSA